MGKKRRLLAKAAGGEAVDAPGVEAVGQMAVGGIFEAPQRAAEAGGELIGAIEGLPSAAVTRALLALARDAGDRALPLLEQLAQSPKTAVALAAVGALGAVPSRQAGDMLAHIADADPNKVLRKEAKRALFKLRGLGVAVATPSAKPEVPRPKYPIRRAVLSSFDGLATRALIFAVERPFGGADRIVCLLNLRKGLTHCLGEEKVREALMDEMTLLVEKPERGSLWAEAPPSYCQHLVQEALSLNPKSGTAVPRGYYHWKDEIGQPAEQYDRPLIYRELSPLEIKWDPMLLEQSGELLLRREFTGWFFEPGEIEPYYQELQQVRRSVIALPGWSQKEREGGVGRRFFAETKGPEEHAVYKRQMEEMAYLFFCHHRLLDARRALAVAVAMEDFRGGELVRIPFLRDLLFLTFSLFERERRGETTISARSLGLITPDQFLR